MSLNTQILRGQGMPRIGTDWEYAGGLNWCFVEPKVRRLTKADIAWLPLPNNCGTFAKLPSGEWRIECDGEAITIPNLKGALYLAAMLRWPICGAITRFRREYAAKSYQREGREY